MLVTLTNSTLAMLASPATVALFDSTPQKDTEYSEYYWGWAEMLHLRRTGKFPVTLWNKANNDPAIKEKGQAFTPGYIAHIAADVTGHPFVNQIVGGPARNRGVMHHIAENHMDVYIWEQRRRANLNTAHLEKYFPQTIPKDFSKYINQAIKGVYGNLIIKNGHTNTTYMDCFAVFRDFMILLTSSLHIDPPVPPSTANIQQALSDMANDASSAINSIAKRHSSQNWPPIRGGTPDLGKILDVVSKTAEMLWEDVKDLAEMIYNEVGNLIRLGVAIATDTVEALLYILECLLYESWRFIRSPAVALNL